MFNGKFTDFSDEWFEEISFFFISPMFVQIIYPVFGVLPMYFFWKFMVMLDRNFTNPELHMTKSKTALQYANY